MVQVQAAGRLVGNLLLSAAIFWVVARRGVSRERGGALAPRLPQVRSKFKSHATWHVRGVYPTRFESPPTLGGHVAKLRVAAPDTSTPARLPYQARSRAPSSEALH